MRCESAKTSICAGLYRAIQPPGGAVSQAAPRLASALPENIATVAGQPFARLAAPVRFARQVCGLAFGVDQAVLPNHAGAVDPGPANHPGERGRP